MRVRKKQEPPSTIDRRSVAAGICLLSIAVAAAASLYLARGPKPKGPDAPLADYSAGRAFNYVSALAAEPHPMGTAAHARTRQFIIEELESLGLEPEVTEGVAAGDEAWPSLRIGRTRNIVARINGTDNTAAILLAAHYDTVPNSPGAADDSSGVATLLETARALQAGPRLRNDVILLFTDGEEFGLFGARAFVESNPMVAEVGLVLNFDARGTRGPVLMPETTPRNRWLIEEAAKTDVRIFGSSLMYEVYQLMPNRTDLTVFKDGIDRGLNFAFIGGYPGYHTALDTSERISRRTLQHQGEYALQLTRHFGDLDLSVPLAMGDNIFFDAAGFFFVTYPRFWAIPSALLLLLAFIGGSYVAVARQHATAGGILVGAIAFALISALCLGAAYLVIDWMLEEQGVLANYLSDWYLAAFAALLTGMFALLYWPLTLTGKDLNLELGAVLWWVLAAAACAIMLPGGSPYFVWPPLISLALILCLTLTIDPRRTGVGRAFLFAAFAAPIAIFFAPVSRLFQQAMTVSMTAGTLVWLALVWGLLLPQLFCMLGRRGWVFPVALSLMGGAGVGLLATAPGYSANRPAHSVLAYGLDAESGDAKWIARGRERTEWTRQVMGADVSKALLPEFFPDSSRSVAFSKAPRSELVPPKLEVISDSELEGKRWLHLRMNSERDAPFIALHALGNTTVYMSDVQGVVRHHGVSDTEDTSETDFAPENLTEGATGWSLQYYALPPEGVDLWVLVDPEAPALFQLIDYTMGFPDIPGSPIPDRPPHIIPAPRPIPIFSDTTLVAKTYRFAPEPD